MRTLFALALLASSATAAPLTFTAQTGGVEGGSSGMGQLNEPASIFFQWLHDSDTQPYESTFTAIIPDVDMGDVGTTWTIDATTASQYGIADWEAFASLTESRDWHRHRRGIVNAKSNVTNLYPFDGMHQNVRTHLETFTLDHVNVFLEMFRQVSPGREEIRVDFEIVGDGVIVIHSGDFDANGLTDGADLLAWQQGDADAPNLAAWKGSYAAPAVMGIPEPRGLALAFMALASLHAARKALQR